MGLTTKDYRMSKPLKTMLSLGRFKSKDDRNAWKRLCMDAEVYARTVERAIFDKTVGRSSVDELE